MATAFQQVTLRPREWRRRVSIPARLRTGSDWANCQILNISTRGMLLQYSRPLEVGSQIEIRQEGRMVPATVVWRDGFRAGLSCERPIPVVEWMTASSEQARAPAVAQGAVLSRRPGTKRRGEEAREFARKLEYVAVAGFAAALAMAAAALAAMTLFEPLAAAARVLG